MACIATGFTTVGSFSAGWTSFGTRQHTLLRRYNPCGRATPKPGRDLQQQYGGFHAAGDGTPHGLVATEYSYGIKYLKPTSAVWILLKSI